MSEAILTTHGLTKRYGARRVVSDLALDVREGDVFGFLGPNGAGKSTTIRMILDLVQPTAGSVTVFGQSLTRERRAVLTRVGALVERADFYNYLDGETNLRVLLRMSGSRETGRIREVLALVGLADRGRDKVKTYSHGMRQRLGIAQALLTRPRLIVLDEPTTGLDPAGMRDVRELLARLAREHGITVFLSSHLLSEVEQVCTRVAIIHRGALVVQDSVERLLRGDDDALDVTPDPANAETCIALAHAARNFPRTRSVEERDSLVRVTVERGSAAALNAHLVGAGVHVAALTPVRSLEEYFLRITGEEGGL